LHHVYYQNYEIWSDQAIPAEIATVLDDATRRLKTSEFYRADEKFTIFFCNASWRLFLFSQHFSHKTGGVADGWLTRYIYIRASDIPANKIYPPGPNPIRDEQVRPLSYFLAHEVTHIIKSRRFGRTEHFRHPRWLIEGYAEYIGKGGDFDFEENFRLWVKRDPLMDYEKFGLYRRFHLCVYFMLKKKGWTVDELFLNPPSEEDVLNMLLADSHSK
jgi:hypothetical protein